MKVFSIEELKLIEDALACLAVRKPESEEACSELFRKALNVRLLLQIKEQKEIA